MRQVSAAAKGNDCYAEGSVGFEGYGFVFRDLDTIKNSIDFQGSGGVYRLGITRRRLEDFKRGFKAIKNVSDYDNYYDIHLIGSIKTLVPTLKFGEDYEHLFEVWIFIQTLDHKRFPATIYYGASNLSLGGWDPSFAYNFTHFDRFLTIFPEEFKSEINSSIYDLSNDEKEALAEVIELALCKVPMSDFYGIYKHDFGNSFIRVKDNKPFIIELGFSPKFNDIDLFLNRGMRFNIKIEEFNKWDIH